MSTITLWGMKDHIARAWALKRPTNEIMSTFIRRTKNEVLDSIAEHFPAAIAFTHRWRAMRRMGFDVVRVEVSVVDHKGNTKVQPRHKTV